MVGTWLHEKNKIYLHLSGGLGNQLFQYGFGRALADAAGSDLCLDATWYDKTLRKAAPRAYELTNYPVRATTARGPAAARCRLQMSAIVRRIPALAPFPWMREPAIYRYFPPAAPTSDIYALGNWQSYKYFEHMRDALRTELAPMRAMSAADCALADRMRSSESVSLHVRRGDFVTLESVRQLHEVCDREFYGRAAARVLERTARPHFFVFSDDPDWVDSNLTFDAPSTVVRHNGPAGAVQDLRLMTLCRHHVTANSSFSWWGAWLREAAPAGMVICPAYWLRGLPTATLDIAPPEWIIV